MNTTPPSGIPSIVVGNRIFTDLANIIILNSSSNAAANYTCFRRGFATAGYQVTAGKTFRIMAIQIITFTASSIVLSYSDNDIGLNQVGPPTNNTNVGGQANFLNSAANTPREIALQLDVPAGKYINWNGFGVSLQSHITLFGYEI